MRICKLLPAIDFSLLPVAQVTYSSCFLSMCAEFNDATFYNMIADGLPKISRRICVSPFLMVSNTLAFTGTIIVFISQILLSFICKFLQLLSFRALNQTFISFATACCVNKHVLFHYRAMLSGKI